MLRITKKQKALLLDIDEDHGLWAGAWESLWSNHALKTLESLLGRELIVCWRTCEDTEYYMLTPKGKHALIPHWAREESKAC
jgi:hypothetical protein